MKLLISRSNDMILWTEWMIVVRGASLTKSYCPHHRVKCQPLFDEKLILQRKHASGTDVC